MKVIGFTLVLALAGITGAAAFAKYEQDPVYNQWSLFTQQAGKWRGVWESLATNFLPLPSNPDPAAGLVNPRKVESFLDLSSDGSSITQINSKCRQARAAR